MKEEEGGSVEPPTRPGASWDVVEGAAVMPEQRNHLDSACRRVSLVDDAARRDPRVGAEGQGSSVSVSGIPTRIPTESSGATVKRMLEM